MFAQSALHRNILCPLVLSLKCASVFASRVKKLSTASSSRLTMRVIAPHSLNIRLLSTTSLRGPSCRLTSTLCFAERRKRWPGLKSATKIHGRGAKSRATVPLRDLQHDGDEVRQPLQESKDDSPGYPAVVQQARNNMRKFENCVLLTRVGSFYEVHNLWWTR